MSPPPAASELAAPIAIVGAGPIGLMLALFLDHYGVRSVLFNIDAEWRWHPKGNTHGARTMEHYRRLGLSERVRALGLPPEHATDVAYFTRFNSHELARIPMQSAAEKLRRVAGSSAMDQIPEPIHRANQMYVERLLFEEACRRPNITARVGWRVTGFSEDHAGVSLKAERVADGATENWRADYLVGCDGSQGIVRRTLGVRYQGLDRLEQAFYGGRMMATYLRAPTLYRDIIPRNGHAWQYCAVNAELRVVLVALDGGAEFLLHSKLADDQAGADDAATIRLVQRAAGAEVLVEILGNNPWTAGVALVAERFVAGRVLLAGDAAHLFTPTGGFGMNTGIDDAANLSWKLAAMIQGWGGATLLQSYEDERKPIAIRNTRAARELAKSVGDLAVPPTIEHDSVAGENVRREVGALLGTFGEEFASIGVQLGARYDASPIVTADGAPPADSLVTYAATSIPGGRAPHLWLDGGRELGSSLFDRLGPGFTLLRLGPQPPEIAALREAAGEWRIPLVVLDIAAPQARDLYGRDLALIRPDQHVAWRGNALPDDVGGLLDRVTGSAGN